MNFYLFQTCFLQEGLQHTAPPTAAMAALGPSLPAVGGASPAGLLTQPEHSRAAVAPRRGPGHDRPHPWTRQTYLVPLLCVIAVREDGFAPRVVADLSLLQVKLPLSFKVKPVLLVLCRESRCAVPRAAGWWGPGGRPEVEG